jgi:uncharacterized membrane protein YidH (DUF202 family)
MFLAWVRTGIAVIAFGFVIEKFNLFVLTMADTTALDAGRRLQRARLSGPLGRYDGLALILLGIALIVVSTTLYPYRTAARWRGNTPRRRHPRRVALVDGVGADCSWVQHLSRARLMRRQPAYACVQNEHCVRRQNPRSFPRVSDAGSA